ncbi:MULTISPECIES: diguanylate cyclase domain-containing protein [unclassified Modestobacter]|uniref:diguanylate cyclase domain-containing protein n=1 Tax=unclassified Modestobacter TaxID=2643866 RepID=UPI0022AA77AA|nr:MULTISPECIES: diguanylate cyclase [unclassified Modestobacter]MCZ2825712.1 diguanylate cyclase [Modestobacter sp. VKM Ac-2981]MCZ2853223.1 diguanylate cyclase [Modestobacter sp. VKM Ac-2982]
MPPGLLHQQVSSALTNWQLDTAEALLREIDGELPAAPVDDHSAAPLTSLARAWADTLRAELLVRRLRRAGYSLLGDPLVEGGPEQEGPLDQHDPDEAVDRDSRSESATQAALAISLVRSARAAFDAQDDDLQRAAGLVRHARIELLSRRVDAAMDEAVESASLLDPALPPSPLLVHTLSSLAAVLADLELMPLALDYQRRAADLTAEAISAASPVSADDAVDALAAEAATRLAALCAEVGEGLLDDGGADAAAPHFAEARDLAVRALGQLYPGVPGLLDAQVVHGWALVGLGEHAAARSLLSSVVSAAKGADDLALLASAELGLGRALRRSGDPRAADDHLATALATATEHGLPRLRRAALRELCTLHAELDDAARALPYLQAYLADELDRVDERRTRWVELFGRRKSLLETERAAGQLRRQAYEDPLTHLPNRRYAEARLDGLLSAGAVPALAVVDIDRFKAINDAAGHPTGDAVLRAVGQLLVDGCRDTDEVCRWAGDEFVILLPDTTSEQAERAMERIRRSIATHDWSALGVEVPVRISVGIAQAARGDDRRTLFAAADGVLYDAKRAGRDRVVRLSGVTQTRAVDTAPDAIDAPVAEADPTAEDTAPVAVPTSSTVGEVTSPLPEDRHEQAEDATGGFAPLLVEPAADDAPADQPSPRLPSPLDELFGGPPTHPAAPRVAEPVASPAPAAAAVPPPVLSPVPVAPVLATGPDVIWGTGRSTEQVLALVREARREHPGHPAVVVRASADTLVALATEHDAYTTMDAAAMSAAVGPVPEPVGRVGVLCASSGDTPIAAEAAFVARVTGTEVVRVDDVGGSRIHPLLTDRSLLTDVDCLVVVAGLDAALASVVSGLTEVPVVAVPTSAGQGASSFGGFSALLTMLNSAAPGVVVSNIDNGWSAGVFAARIARRTAALPPS